MRNKGLDRTLEPSPFLGYIDPGAGFTIASGSAWIIVFIASFFGVLFFQLKKIKNFFGKHKKFLLTLTAIVIVAAGITAINPIGKSNSKNRVIILGFDALSPKIIEPLMGEGALPNFARLKALGSYAPLATTNPSQSPVAWSGFATGSNAGKHGVCDFIVRDPKNYGLSLSISKIEGLRPQKAKKIPSFWEYAAKKKVPATILSCPVTFPPDKVYGKMLSGMGVPDILGTEGTFTYYTSEAVGDSKDVGGKVFNVARGEKMTLSLIGPRKQVGDGVENIKVPFEVTLKDGSGKAEIKLEGSEKFSIEKGRWSDWQAVNFKISAFKTAKGIFKFYLVEAEPGFKLYISPINLDPRAPFFPISYPANYSRELAGKIGLFHTQGMPFDTWAVNEKRFGEKELLEQIDNVFKERRSMMAEEMALLKSGIFFVYFEDADIIQHMFWRYTDERHPLYEKDAPVEYKEAIRNCYIKLDAVLGDVMAGLKEGDTLIVLSDHGFGSFRRVAHINSWLKENGYLKLKEDQARSGGELLEDVDWDSTKAYAIGFGGIYINQRGREGQGIVEPGSETENLKAEIAAKMRGWTDDRYNEPVVKYVYSRDEIFWGPYAWEMPDLYVGFNTGYRASWQTALGAVPEVLLEDNLKKWSGDHLFDPKIVPGVLFTNKKVKTEAPSIYDIAPSVLKLIGYTDEEIARFGMDGKEIF
jgi:predicted AlkP superfamily phosphohydrolase/phosphomutase